MRNAAEIRGRPRPVGADRLGRAFLPVPEPRSARPPGPLATPADRRGRFREGRSTGAGKNQENDEAEQDRQAQRAGHDKSQPCLVVQLGGAGLAYCPHSAPAFRSDGDAPAVMDASAVSRADRPAASLPRYVGAAAVAAPHRSRSPGLAAIRDLPLGPSDTRHGRRDARYRERRVTRAKGPPSRSRPPDCRPVPDAGTCAGWPPWSGSRTRTRCGDRPARRRAFSPANPPCP